MSFSELLWTCLKMAKCLINALIGQLLFQIVRFLIVGTNVWFLVDKRRTGRLHSEITEIPKQEKTEQE